ncbi:hypothetical protein SAMN05216359_102619 [Roseateles sp. YR242]|uniref:hypothetical protein n=1 Tax=Roseateles sp. YR242 TaxID=1855305 RepID=UPI0008AF3DA7|nr:hypothetical protein [Roseateles sp. YR242]SEK67069.1 hypothetical protein SAMN05216359_102619 [Roseateles sp. YR242]
MWRDMQQRLKLRQMELQLRSAELRVQLAQDVRAMEQPLRWADRGYGLWRLLRSLPVGWRAASALGGLGGLLGLLKLFKRPGKVARVWAWLSLARRVWRWMRPAHATRPDEAESPAHPR